MVRDAINVKGRKLQRGCALIAGCTLLIAIWFVPQCDPSRKLLAGALAVIAMLACLADWCGRPLRISRMLRNLVGATSVVTLGVIAFSWARKAGALEALALASRPRSESGPSDTALILLFVGVAYAGIATLVFSRPRERAPASAPPPKR